MQVTLRSLEAMGTNGLSGTAQTRRVGACSVEHQQVRARSVAGVADTGPVDRAPLALLRTSGTTESCAPVGIGFIEPPGT